MWALSGTGTKSEAEQDHNGRDLQGGHYRIGKKISGGGMGDVYYAHDTTLDRRVAFKVIKPEHLNDREFRERFKREARAAAAVSHPGVAQVYDYADDGNAAFIVYEFIEGVALKKKLGEHRFTTEEILDVGIKITDALVVVHERSIHRDLKPANIMRTPHPGGFDRVKILDFGLVKPLVQGSDQGRTTSKVESLTEPGMQPGTIDYMSPEQLRVGEADQRSDIHALGLILYEMATGVHPFRGSDIASTVANILMQEPPRIFDRNPDPPPELDLAIRKCLRKNREERYQSAKELLIDLSSLRAEIRKSSGVQSASMTALPGPPVPVARAVARGLFLFIQAAYLARYAALVIYLPDNLDRVGILLPGGCPPRFPLAGMVILPCSLAVRFYLLAAVGADYADLGRMFRLLFPAILLIDLAWAASPLLLYREMEGLAWFAVVALAYLPFARRSLIYSAYSPRGGRTSGVRAGTAA